MGTVFRTYVVAGVRAAHAIKAEPTGHLITKYNEDTGEPYQKRVDGPDTVFLFGRLIPGVHTTDPDTVLSSFGKRLPKVLDVFGPGGEQNWHDYVIGMEIVRIGPCEAPFALDPDTIEAGLGKARVALAQVGYNHGVHAPIGVYVIHYAG